MFEQIDDNELEELERLIIAFEPIVKKGGYPLLMSWFTRLMLVFAVAAVADTKGMMGLNDSERAAKFINDIHKSAANWVSDENVAAGLELVEDMVNSRLH